MSAAKHTPGPWYWSNEYLTSDNERNTWTLLGFGGYGILSCDGDANSPHSLGASGEANASLIAAAPELLEALERLSAQCERLRLPGWAMSDAERNALEVIARAKGVTQ